MIRKLCFIAALALCSAAASISQAADRPEKMIGVSLLAATNPFFVDMGNAMKTEAAKHGMEVIITSADFDAAKQKNQVSDFIVKRVSAIILCPADSKAIGTSIAESHKAGIPVFTADIAALAEKDKVICHVATDNFGGGREAGRAMVTALQGNGKVAILDHPEVESVILRTRGFKEVIDAHNLSGKGKIEIVAILPGGGAKEKSFAAANDLLQAHPDLNGIFAINDPSALGAVAALEKAGKLSRVKVIGFDGMPEGKQAIKDGKIWGDPIQFPDKIGAETIQAIVKYLEGEDVQKEILIPTALYTKTEAEKDSSLK